MKPILASLVLLLAGCAGPSPLQVKERLVADDLRSIAIVPSPLAPAAKLEAPRRGGNQGALVGATGGAVGGAALGYGSAGVLCTIGGPLCALVVVPAAIVGGLIGGVAGGVVDRVADDVSDEGKARRRIGDAVAELRASETLAEAAYRAARLGTSFPLAIAPEAKEDYRVLAAQGITAALEVAVTQFDVVAREKEMAIALRVRSRLYRTADGKLLEEFSTEARSDFRGYEAWAANQAEPLRQALRNTLARLGESIAEAHLGAQAFHAASSRISSGTGTFRRARRVTQTAQTSSSTVAAISAALIGR